MARLYPLFARFGLFVTMAPRTTDAFEQRLTRIGLREARARSLGLTFRNRP